MSIDELLYLSECEFGRKSFRSFVLLTKPDYKFNRHHEYLCQILENFVKKEIKKLMIFMPPQHGKSELVSRRLPAYLLGKNPDLKIASASYSYALARRFNRDVQRILTSEIYKKIFENTRINEKSSASVFYAKTTDMFEIVNRQGSYTSVGVGGGLTGNRVDVMIIDDPVKDAVQASSPAFQLRAIEWYDSVVSTRLHNDSQIILCMTRWDTDDLAGLLLSREASDWQIIRLPAIREDLADPYDHRKLGEALWDEKHSLDKLLKIKQNSPKVFQSLYQQSPQSPEEVLIFAKAVRTNDLPNAYEKIIGLDFGFSHSPTAIALIEVDRKQKRIWAKEIYYKTGASNTDIANFLREYKLLVYCDSAEPKSIEELRVKGVQAKPASKFKNSVLTQILFLQEFEIRYIGENADFEKRHYQWQVGADGKPINQEVDKYNHFWKAVMYAVYTHLAETNPRQKQKLVKMPTYQY